MGLLITGKKTEKKRTDVQTHSYSVHLTNEQLVRVLCLFGQFSAFTPWRFNYLNWPPQHVGENLLKCYKKVINKCLCISNSVRNHQDHDPMHHNKNKIESLTNSQVKSIKMKWTKKIFGAIKLNFINSVIYISLDLLDIFFFSHTHIYDHSKIGAMPALFFVYLHLKFRNECFYLWHLDLSE